MITEKMKFEDLVSLLRYSTDKFAKRPLFGTRKAKNQWEWLTYEDFGRQVDWIRGGLVDSGLKPGDTIAIISGNRPEWAVTAYAAFTLGATFVPMYETQTIDDWKHIIKDCDAKILIVSTEKIRREIKALPNEQVPNLKYIFCLETDVPGGPTSYELVMYSGQTFPSLSINPSPEDLACIIYTSGTTGKPKGVELTHKNIASNVSAVRGLFPLGPSDRCLSFLPWAHAFGQTAEMHTFLSLGASIAICDDITKLLDYLAEVQPTVLCAVPRIFNRIYAGVQQKMAKKRKIIRFLFERGLKAAIKQNSGETLERIESSLLFLADLLIFSKIRRKFGGRLRFAISGGAALSPEVARFIDSLGIPVYEGYGLSETAPIITCNYPGNRKIGSVGKTIPNVGVICVSDEDGNREIVVHGSNVMRGYHGLPEETRAAFTEHNGLRTGDIGHFDGDHFLYVTGRIKEQYKLENGKYVVPAPLEESIKMSPLIANVMIYGDNRPFNVALVIPELGEVKRIAKDKKHALSQNLLEDPRVLQMIQAEIDRLSKAKNFRGYEKIHKIALLSDDFTQENGLLTPTLKLKRRKALELYAEKIDELYN